MTDAPLSNSLTALAIDVRTAMTVSASAEKTAIQAAIEAGRLLAEAKSSCRHGEWLPFLKRAAVPERKAQRYMKLAWSCLKSDTVSDLGGINATLRWMDGLRAPEAGECLVVSLDGFAPDIRDTLAVAWPVGDSAEYAVFNPRSEDSFLDLLKKPVEKTETLLPAIYQALDHRYRDMSFAVISDRLEVAAR